MSTPARSSVQHVLANGIIRQLSPNTVDDFELAGGCGLVDGAHWRYTSGRNADAGH